MRLSTLLFGLGAAALVAAQDQSAESSAPAASTAGSAASAEHSAAKTKSAIGAHSSNTGTGNSGGNDAWKETSFEVPNRNYYWVNEVENTASWKPFNASTNLELYNTNKTLLEGNKPIASNIPAGVGSWTGLVSGFAPGNNYIMILVLSDEPDRKIAQTEGFWIKSKGTIPEASVSAAGEKIAGTLSVSSTSPTASSTEGSGASGAVAAGDASSSAAPSGEGGSKSAASRSAVAVGAVVAAVAAAAVF